MPGVAHIALSFSLLHYIFNVLLFKWGFTAKCLHLCYSVVFQVKPEMNSVHLL